jgi:predicted phosphodiesterase
LRALILSDIHSNLEAFEAVLDDARRRGGFDALWCLGDLVGYGPDPGACLELLGQHSLLAVAGNHDHAAIGRIDLATFNRHAAAAARWTADRLSPHEADFLESLPLVVSSGSFTLVHGSLRAPLWEYLLSQEAAQGTLELLETRYCLVGHSHIPFICKEESAGPDFIDFTEDLVIPLNQQRWIINPGGVGQPRDRDPRPSYAIYDDERETIERHRVTYDIAGVQRKMRKLGLPQQLIERLEYGV